LPQTESAAAAGIALAFVSAASMVTQALPRFPRSFALLPENS
jgi:hypothetical protein